METYVESQAIVITEEELSERRRHARTDRMKELSAVWHYGGQRFISCVSDLSLSGAFLESETPPAMGTTLQILFRVSGKVARARAMVQRSVPGEGMGIEFVAMEQEDRACLAAAAESAHELVPITDKQQPKPNDVKVPTPKHEGEPVQKELDLSPTERRGRRRSKVPAQVEIAEADSGRVLGARLGTLSAGGCFLELEADHSLSLGAPVTITIARGPQSFQSAAKVVYVLPSRGIGLAFYGTEPQHVAMLTGWIMETSWLATDRRMSQRIVLSVPVIVMGNNAMGFSFTEEAQTIRVSADGCSLVLSTELNKGQYVTLLNGRTKAMAECMIVRVERTLDAQREIGMAFPLPNRTFWQVNFPPVE